MKVHRNLDGMRRRASVPEEQLAHKRNLNALLWDRMLEVRGDLEVRQAGFSHIHNTTIHFFFYRPLVKDESRLMRLIFYVHNSTF
jgi:phosphoribosyl 1,2-cyclic phosphodiesterase